MAKDAQKRKDKLYNVLALLLMAALFGCGVWGVVESRIAKRDYKNSPDALTPEDDELYDDILQQLQLRTEFAADGTVSTLLAVPEEMRAEAARQGVTVREDGYAVVDSTTWKEVDGRFYYDTGITGEVMGEPTDPFMAIDVTEDGCLLYQMGMILLERACPQNRIMQSPRNRMISGAFPSCRPPGVSPSGHDPAGACLT